MPKKRTSNTAVARRITALEQKIDILAQQHAPQSPAGGLQRAAKAIENFGLTRILAAAGAWLVFVTVISFWFDFAARTEERTARAEEAAFRKLAQVATAWELLLTKAGGDIGKGNAINTILAAQGQLQGADLSCENAGVFRNGKCVTPPQYNDVVLGDGDFWEDDPERAECGGFGGCETRSYISGTDFRETEITDLVAEKLYLDRNFDGVVAQGWKVRRADYEAGFSGADRSTFIDKAPEFSCDECWFFQSTLSWQSAKGFDYPVFESTVVDLPHAGIAEMPARYFFQTFLDDPVLFMRRGIQEAHNDAYDAAEKSGEPSTFDPTTFIEWRMYENGDFCLDKSDLKFLWPHIEELQKIRQAGWDASSLARMRTAHLRGEKNNLDLVPSDALIVVVVDWTLETALENDFYTDLQITQFRDQRFGTDNVKQKAYACSYDFEDVEPLLRERVAEQLSRWVIEE